VDRPARSSLYDPRGTALAAALHHRGCGIVACDRSQRRRVHAAEFTLSLIFTLLAISGAALYSAHCDFDKTKEMLDKLLPALTGLIGSALGFYFGSKSSNA
jgi:hypothetical protein